MIRRKIILIAFLFSSLLLFAQNRPVKNLSLSFECQTINHRNGEKDSFRGKVTYKDYPYSFSYKIVNPEQLEYFQNVWRTYVIQNSRPVLLQAADDYIFDMKEDFLSWFKSDFGLSDDGYQIYSIKRDGNNIRVEYKLNNDYAEILQNAEGQGIELLIYDSQKNLAEKYSFENYSEVDGIKFPSLIKIENYDGDFKTFESCLQLSKVDFSLVTVNNGLAVYYLSESESIDVELKNEEIYTDHQEEGKSTTTVILAQAAYNFYKKYITDQDIPGCLFTPTCSTYMMQAISKKGLPGIIYGINRLHRCNPRSAKLNMNERNSDGKIIEEFDK